MILCVSADAEMHEIKKVAQRSIMELRLSGDEDTTDIRRIENALETLQDPVERFQWGLFWPELTAGEAESFRTDPVLSTLACDQSQDAAAAYESISECDSVEVRSHNIGVLALLRAVAATEEAQRGTPDDIEDDLECVRIWHEAFRHLRLVVESDRFWLRQKFRAKALGDARLDGARLRELRAGLLREILTPTGVVITTALLDGHINVATAYVDLLRESGFEDSLIEETLSNVYKPLADRVERQLTHLGGRLADVTAKTTEDVFQGLLDAFQANAFRDLNVMLAVGDLPGYAEEHARDMAAEFLRSLAIRSWKGSGKSMVSRQSLSLATTVAAADSVISSVRNDHAKLEKAESERHTRDLQLSIRSDTLSITEAGIRYRNQSIAADDLYGLRLGIFVQITNGSRSASYRIDYRSLRGSVINIECTRMMRSEAKAKADYQAIVEATFLQLASGLVSRVSKYVVSGKGYDMGRGCFLTSKGVKFSTGVLWWKTEHLIPYRDVRCSTDQGMLTLASSRVEKAQFVLSLRDRWNAVLFQQIVQAIMEAKGD